MKITRHWRLQHLMVHEIQSITCEIFQEDWICFAIDRFDAERKLKTVISVDETVLIVVDWVVHIAWTEANSYFSAIACERECGSAATETDENERILKTFCGAFEQLKRTLSTELPTARRLLCKETHQYDSSSYLIRNNCYTICEYVQRSAQLHIFTKCKHFSEKVSRCRSWIFQVIAVKKKCIMRCLQRIKTKQWTAKM